MLSRNRFSPGSSGSSLTGASSLARFTSGVAALLSALRAIRFAAATPSAFMAASISLAPVTDILTELTIRKCSPTA